MLKKLLAVFLVLAILPAGASACTAIYIGSGLTEDGSTIFARQEEFSSDEGWPKLFEVIPEGAHPAGEVYTGCFGFTWKRYGNRNTDRKHGGHHGGSVQHRIRHRRS